MKLFFLTLFSLFTYKFSSAGCRGYYVYTNLFEYMHLAYEHENTDTIIMSTIDGDSLQFFLNHNAECPEVDIFLVSINHGPYTYYNNKIPLEYGSYDIKISGPMLPELRATFYILSPTELENPTCGAMKITTNKGGMLTDFIGGNIPVDSITTSLHMNDNITYTIYKKDYCPSFEEIKLMKNNISVPISIIYSNDDSLLFNTSYQGEGKYQVKFKVEKNYAGEFVFKNHLNISEFDVSNITIFPNPSKDFVYIKLPENRTDINLSIKIYTLLGDILLDKIAQSNHTQINISNYAKGLYILCIEDRNESIIKKIIVEKQ